MCTVQIIDEVPETIFSPCSDYKNIVNIPPPCVRFCLSPCNWLSLQFVHKNIGIRRCHSSPYRCTFFLDEMFPIKLKVVVFKNYFSKIYCHFLDPLVFFPSSKLESQANYASFTACNPSSCGIWGYNPTTSTVHNIAPSGNVPMSISFLKKSLVSFM